MMKYIILSLLLSFPCAAKTIKVKTLNFEVSKHHQLSENIYYSFKEFKDDDFIDSDLSSLDVENYSSQPDNKLLISKSTFSIQKNINSIQIEKLFKTQVIKKLMGANKLERINNGINHWKSNIPVIVYNVKSELRVTKLSNENTEDIKSDYFYASKEFDLNLNEDQFQVHIELFNFNQAFESLTIICKFVPYRGRTTVVSYFIAKTSKKWWKKRNLFGIASNKVKQIMLDVLKNTKDLL